MSRPNNAPSWDAMERAAKLQAIERTGREGVACLVYVKADPGLPVWYVRTEAEGKPEGARLIYVAGNR